MEHEYEISGFFKGFESWARDAEDKAAELTKVMTSFESIGDLVMGLIVIALLPAIGEELVFRGMFQNEFFRGTRKHSPFHLGVSDYIQRYSLPVLWFHSALIVGRVVWVSILLVRELTDSHVCSLLQQCFWRYYGLPSPSRDHGPQRGRQCRCTASIRNLECCSNSRATVLYLETLSTTSWHNLLIHHINFLIDNIHVDVL